MECINISHSATGYPRTIDRLRRCSLFSGRKATASRPVKATPFDVTVRATVSVVAPASGSGARQLDDGRHSLAATHIVQWSLEQTGDPSRRAPAAQLAIGLDVLATSAASRPLQSSPPPPDGRRA